ncbi:leukocyte-specific transcript 1 protein isoform X3 [Lagenorhynchus albirostris]|uniref:leukocyte-specific transcript 1 protein isoform X3 n=1 Tax=Lagenorhynchus albirostris TaxID=27610 RepID=UPI0028E466B7|nr:leukocyte-specific transcript 1 protein isoform X3 [Lagenorhynchus albirostris]
MGLCLGAWVSGPCYLSGWGHRAQSSVLADANPTPPIPNIDASSTWGFSHQPQPQNTPPWNGEQVRHLYLGRETEAQVCLGKRRRDIQTTRKGLGDIRAQQHHRNVERGPAKRQRRHPHWGTAKPAEQEEARGTARVRRLERSWAQLSQQELHYASLLRLPEREGPDLGNQEREGSKEDPSTDYACIAKNKPV